MSWASVIPAAAGVASALIGANANKRAAAQTAQGYQTAAGTSAESTQAALDYLRESRDLGRADLAPYRSGGQADYEAYRGNVGTDFRAAPGYEFAREEGIRAIDQAAAARGMLGSGGRLRELMRYGTGVADQGYQQWLSRLQGLAGAGQAASGQTSSLAASTGAQGAGITQQGGSALANLAIGQGQANAQGTQGVANALLGGMNQAAGLWSLMRS